MVWQEQRLDAIAKMDGRQSMLFVDNQSKLSRYCMVTLPRSKYLSLSSKEMAVGLSYRTLRPGHNRMCRKCSKENTLGHDEVCVARPRFYTYRHEGIKSALDHHLSQVADTTVRVEWKQRDPITNRPTRGDLRTDLIVTGKASYLQDTSEYDLTVRSMYSQGIDYEAAPFAGLRLDSEPTEIFKSIQSKIQKTLDKHAQDKTRKYKEVCRNIFFPLVLSVGGGFFATETVAVFDHWKDVMGKTRYRFLTTDMSIGLLRAKSFSFIL